MTPEKQRIAVAELRGWRLHKEPSQVKWIPPSGSFLYPWHKTEDAAWEYATTRMLPTIPDYLNDWNTRPDLLEVIVSRGLTRHVVNNVCVLMARPQEISNDMMGWGDEHLWMCLSVPQPVFIEALLKTVNKWEEL